MKKMQFSVILFIFLMFPIIVLASEARIIPIGSGEVGDCTSGNGC